MRYPHGHDFEYIWLHPSQIKFDPLYQRPLDNKKVTKIVKEFNGDLFNEPKVSFRDGQYWCFNGQHTIASWRQLHKGDDKLICCKVYRGMTWVDECQAFLDQNGISSDPTMNQKLRALYNKGNEDVIDMVKKAELCGFVVDFATSKTPTRIIATNALFKAYKKLSADAYLDMMTAIRDAWFGEIDAISGQIISGMSDFYKLYYGNFKREDLVKSIRKVKPVLVIRNGKEVKSVNGYTREILKLYNLKRRSGRLDESLLLGR